MLFAFLAHLGPRKPMVRSKGHQEWLNWIAWIKTVHEEKMWRGLFLEWPQDTWFPGQPGSQSFNFLVAKIAKEYEAGSGVLPHQTLHPLASPASSRGRRCCSRMRWAVTKAGSRLNASQCWALLALSRQCMFRPQASINLFHSHMAGSNKSLAKTASTTVVSGKDKLKQGLIHGSRQAPGFIGGLSFPTNGRFLQMSALLVVQ